MSSAPQTLPLVSCPVRFVGGSIVGESRKPGFLLHDVLQFVHPELHAAIAKPRFDAFND